MGIKRYTANKDTTITDAFKENLSTRGTAGNMGASDILETYSIYGQATSGSLERTRILVQFPIDKILEDRNNTTIPASGSVEFYINLFNAPHSQTVPTDYVMSVASILTSWDEGHGLDMEEFKNEEAANWITSSGTPDCTDGIQSTATLTFTGAPTLNQTITIISTDQTSLQYTAKDAESLADKQFNRSGTSEATVDSLQRCIEHSAGHNGKIVCSQDSTGLILTLTQRDPSPSGDTTITENLASVAKTDFTGGASAGCTGGSLWVNQGGDFLSGGLNTSDDFTYSQHFETGLENLSINITPLVEQWLSTQAGTAQVVANCKLNFGGQPASGSYIEVSNPYGHTRRFIFNTANTNEDQPDETIATGSDQVNYINVLIGADQDATMTNLQKAISGSIYSFPSSSAQGIETDLNIEDNYLSLTSSYSGIAGNTKMSMNGTTNITFASHDTATTVKGFLRGSGMDNYGVGVFLSGSYEDGAQERSYYTKKFFGRGSHHFFRKPVIEARWDSRYRDDREDVFLSSSLLPAEQNLYRVYLYNYFAGNLYDIPGPDPAAGELRVSLYPGIDGEGHDAIKLPWDGGVYSVATNTEIRAVKKETGVYEATFAITGSTGTKYYDVWKSFVSGSTTQIHTGSGITVKSHSPASVSSAPSYVLSMPNLKQSYSVEELAKFRMTARLKDWQPTIYTKASNQVQLSTVKGAHYQIKRISDNFVVVPYSTGSINYSGLSYDASGSYFDLDISTLESNYAYELSFLFKVNGSYKEQKDKFKFRVDP